MEVPGGTDNKIVVCLCEMLGTAFLLLAVNWGQGARGCWRVTSFDDAQAHSYQRQRHDSEKEGHFVRECVTVLNAVLFLELVVRQCLLLHDGNAHPAARASSSSTKRHCSSKFDLITARALSARHGHFQRMGAVAFGDT